jgi:hypothetical protein
MHAQTHTNTHYNLHKHRQQLQRTFKSIRCCNLNPQRSVAPKFLSWLLESKNIYRNLTLHPLISSSGVTWSASFTFHQCQPHCWSRLVGYKPLWLNLYLPPSKMCGMLFNTDVICTGLLSMPSLNICKLLSVGKGKFITQPPIVLLHSLFCVFWWSK